MNYPFYTRKAVSLGALLVLFFGSFGLVRHYQNILSQITPAGGLAAVGVSSASAAADAQDVFSPPTELWLTKNPYSPVLYGPSDPSAFWHLAQWSNPEGNLPPFVNGVASSSGFQVRVLAPGSFRIRQITRTLTCNLANNAGEFDAFIGPVKQFTFPGFPVATSTTPSLSNISHLYNKVTLHFAALSYLDFGCPVSQNIQMTAIQLSNNVTNQAFFYQLTLGQERNGVHGWGQPSYWWAAGVRQSTGVIRYGLADRVDTTYGQPVTQIGGTTTYDLDMYARLVAVIRSGAYGIDTDISHWKVNNVYFGSAVWGHISVTSEWKDYSISAVPNEPELSFTAAPSVVAYNGTTTLAWTSTQTKSCKVTGPSGTKAITSGTSGSFAVPVTSPSGTVLTYTLGCIGPFGDSVNKQASVTVAARDTKLPTVRLTAPAGNIQTVGGTVTLSATASDNAGIASVAFKIDGEVVGKATSAPYTFRWDSTTVKNGSHTLAVVARDTSDNTHAATRELNVQNTAPSTNSYAPRGYISSPNQSSQSCGITGWTCDPDRLSDNLEVEFYEGSKKIGQSQTAFIRGDASAIAAACGAVQKSDGTYTSNFTTAKGFRVIFADLPQGTHWIEAYAKDIDSAGNQTGSHTQLLHTANYASPIVCDPSVMKGTLDGAVTVHSTGN
jgi:hypothetical protein